MYYLFSSQVQQQKQQKKPQSANTADGSALADIPDSLHLPEPTWSDEPPIRGQRHQGPGPGLGQAAARTIDTLYVHYDTAKVYYRRRMDSLRHEEKQLRNSLDVNKREQRQTRRSLGMVTSIKRQIAYVNDKEFLLEQNVTEDLSGPLRGQTAAPPTERESLTTRGERKLPIWKY